LKGETYQTIKLLQDEDYAQHQYNFSMIIGMDNANTFDKWVNYELLEKMIRFVVVPRPGCKIDTSVNWYHKPPHIFMGYCDSNIEPISSTLFRNLYKTDRDGAKRLVGKEVYDYIFKNTLYGH
jgi:nicotinate-nucleotide adenylyltransferase